MDERTEGVTLLAGFVHDVVGPYRGDAVFAALTETAQGADQRAAEELVPMSVYNDCCTWIEKRLGSASIRRAGVAIGDRAFDSMVSSGKLRSEPSPLDVMRALKWAADNMIQDPHKRGWEIVSSEPQSIVMRRTQTFNCMLQEGLLVSLARRSAVNVPDVRHEKCTRKGDDFCEYNIRWL